MGTYKMPSHDVFHKPGDEGSCPAMPTESIGGKSFPNGDNSHPAVGSVDLPLKSDPVKHSGGGSDPTPAMPGA